MSAPPAATVTTTKTATRTSAASTTRTDLKIEPPTKPQKTPPSTTQNHKEHNMVVDISKFIFLRHLRAEPTSHVLFFKDGALKETGPGLAFWFLPLGASVSVVPLDDRELPFLFKGRSNDFQDVSVNGAVVWRVKSPEELARRVDFSVDTESGNYQKEPLDRIAAAVGQAAQQLASEFLNKSPLRAILDDGVEVIRGAIDTGLRVDPGLAAMGVEIVAVRVSSVLPTSEMEKALQMPAREHIQQQADQATFQRRALAVEKERAIQENELHNQIELAKREETLIAQRGQNERRRATETAESKRIEAEAAAKNIKLNADAQAQSIKVLEEAKVTAEKERMDIYKDLSSATMMGLAARELAGKLQNIEHLTLSPDMLGSLLQRVMGAGAKRLEADAE